MGRRAPVLLAWGLLLAAILWAYRFTPALGINSVDGWADVAGARVESASELWELLSAPLTLGVAGKNANFYRPTAMLWFAGLRGVFGTWGAGWQASSLFLHLGCVGLVAALSRRLGGSPWEALAAGALLGLHPLGLDVVPALDRSPDLLGTALVLGALLLGMRGRAVLAALVAVLALGAKETMLAGMPVLVALLWDRHGPRRALYALGLMLGGLGIYLSLRSHVLSGFGGYESAVLRPQGLGTLLRAGALEFLAAGWAAPLEALFPSLVQQTIVGSLVSAALVAVAWSGRDEASVRVGVLLALLPLVLLGLTAAFSRRTIYLPLTGFVLWMSATAFRAPWGKGLGVALALLLLPGSPLVRADRAWTLAASMDRSLTSGVVDQVAELPEGTQVWLVDRCVQVDIDPWLSGMWREGRSTVYCTGGYSVAAYYRDTLDREIPIAKITNTFPEQAPAPAQVRVGGDTLQILRPMTGRRVSRAARDAGWTVDSGDGVLRLQAGGGLSRPWVLVAGAEDGILVQAP